MIAGIYTTRTAVALLKRTAVPLMELDVPKSIDGVRKQYVEMAEVLGERSKGESVVADIDARLAKLAAVPAGRRPRTVVLNPNGVTVGQETLANEIMTRAGLENIAASLRIDNYGQIPLEIIDAERRGPDCEREPRRAAGHGNRSACSGDRPAFPARLAVLPTTADLGGRQRDRRYGNAYTTSLVLLAVGAPNQLLPIFQR